MATQRHPLLPKIVCCCENVIRGIAPENHCFHPTIIRLYLLTSSTTDHYYTCVTAFIFHQCRVKIVQLTPIYLHLV